ncbi:MAG TPA: fasciclin domain-containing protein [Propylenella sp.]
MTCFASKRLERPAPRLALAPALIAASLVLLPHTSVALSIEEMTESGEFRIFSTALKQSGLWDRIASEEGVTLFLVSDKAMRDEGSAFLLEKVLLTKYNQGRLFELMSYHVSFDSLLLPDEIQGEVKVSTSSEACLPVYRLGTGIRVGPEAVVTGVKRIDSGIVYVIDRLLWQRWDGEEICRGSLAGLP